MSNYGLIIENMDLSHIHLAAKKIHENMSADLNCRDFSETLDESD
jgi:hypothetical protein